MADSIDGVIWMGRKQREPETGEILNPRSERVDSSCATPSLAFAFAFPFPSFPLPRLKSVRPRRTLIDLLALVHATSTSISPAAPARSALYPSTPSPPARALLRLSNDTRFYARSPKSSFDDCVSHQARDALTRGAMSSQRYERISNRDDEDRSSVTHSRPSSPSYPQHHPIPNSPPPSFRSHASSPRRQSLSDREPLVSAADRELADTFESPSDSESDNEDRALRQRDDRQRVLNGRDSESATKPSSDDAPGVERRVTQLPIFAPATPGRVYGGGNGADGVFANLSAKPTPGEDLEEKPPTYEQAAADATPPYWENTIFAPSGSASSDEVYIDGLPVGSLFSFVWNGMISMSFQLVGFLLTYLLHSTHAAKNGSKAGLGITLIQYGFSLKGASSNDSGGSGDDGSPGSGNDFVTPADPNNHNFDPNNPVSGDGVFIPNSADVPGGDSGAGGSGFALGASDWFAYALMIVGWFVLIRSISEYLKARRHEALVLQSPSRGLNIAVIAEGEEPAGAV